VERGRGEVEAWARVPEVPRSIELVPHGKYCKFCRVFLVFNPCFPVERYNANLCRLTSFSLGDEYEEM
jgi:hypothetical protein